MAKRICQIFGAVFVVLGLAGFFAPGLLGAHLNASHNFVHLTSGFAALYFGFFASADNAEVFSYVFGTAYALLGVAGFLLGGGSEKMMELGPLMLGKVDHLIHVVLGS